MKNTSALIKVNHYICCGIFLISCFLQLRVSAQTLPVGGLLENVEDALRRQQLLGLDSSHNSFMIRPLSLSNKIFNGDTSHLALRVSDLSKQFYRSKNGSTELYLLPVTWINQFNSHHPYGMNDGSMIPAKGYQTQLSAGVYAKIGPLSVQLRPELVFAENKDYRELSETSESYNAYYNRIDQPSRYGSGTYTKLNWGQSSIRLTFDPVSIALSNENLWWGPGMHNSLLMSNDAPGFKHLTLNTSKPIKTYIGSFETQIIGGKLEPSGINIFGGIKNKDKPNDWRYLSGIIFTYQPKWIPNLYLGIDRSFIIYHKDLKRKFNYYLPIFTAALKESYTDKENIIVSEDQIPRDQYISGFARWVFPESRAEAYFQFGRNDTSYDIRDLLLEPESSRAYIVGYRKLLELKKEDTYIQLGMELTRLEGTNPGDIRDEPIWYAHSKVPAGYTHKGQMLGAGIGPESNQQTFDVAWVNGSKRVGLRVENTAYNVTLSKVVDGDRKTWSDLSFSGKFDWDFANFILSSQMTYIKSTNYQYVIGGKANNLQIRVGLMYNY
ncbi:MAG TPA: capsule assembly Wzi family protein [Pedobacter sp.]|uniref:capsule assembly Wzi family protein n=1 Tax=Pedobacter sp. TaxID=1411316 RepID=UPI002BA420A3|nr:capsule assembly Wzi family protein [Pedobacter sp.]HMI00876.1 capsule assembly Wzi family protein [Pedobacter sp.]